MDIDIFELADRLGQRPDWIPLELVPDVLRERGRRILQEFDWGSER
jgi:hypothetical protein